MASLFHNQWCASWKHCNADSSRPGDLTACPAICMHKGPEEALCGGLVGLSLALQHHLTTSPDQTGRTHSMARSGLRPAALAMAAAQNDHGEMRRSLATLMALLHATYDDVCRKVFLLQPGVTGHRGLVRGQVHDHGDGRKGFGNSGACSGARRKASAFRFSRESPRMPTSTSK